MVKIIVFYHKAIIANNLEGIINIRLGDIIMVDIIKGDIVMADIIMVGIVMVGIIKMTIIDPECIDLAFYYDLNLFF